MNSKNYETLTNTIIEIINSDKVLNFSDFNRFLPSNAVTGNAYKGFNKVILSSSLIMNEWKSPFFATFKQVSALGGTIIKGEKSTLLHFYSQTEKENEEGEKEEKFILKFFRVFNLDQTTLENDTIEVEPAINDFNFDRVKSLPNLSVSGLGKAFYQPKDDFIHMPILKHFKSEDQWKEVFLHELTHWTGHESRLNRLDNTKLAAFGDIAYSKEELIAELGSFFLAMDLGVNKDFESGASYLRSWVNNLSDNRYELLQASKKACQAVDFIKNLPGR